MEEWKIFLPVLIYIAIYLFKLFLKKPDKGIEHQKPMPSKNRQEQANSPAGRPKTFEEMMQEIMERREKENQPKPVIEPNRPDVRQPRQVPEPRRPEIKQPVPVIEKVKQKQQKAHETIQQHQQTLDALQQKKEALKRTNFLAEQALRPEAYRKREAAPTSIYSDLLNSPEDARKAIILSEILNRKY